jgi:hypothetical protein
VKERLWKGDGEVDEVDEVDEMGDGHAAIKEISRQMMKK